MQYGILIGRFQPLHAGHQAIINEIMHDGLTPVVLIGSSESWNHTNPLSYVERSLLINQVYGGSVVTLPLPDKLSDLRWIKSLGYTLENSGIDARNCTLYYWRKKGDFDLLPLLSHFKFKQPEYPDIYEGLSATKIRNDPEKYKKYLDGRVLKKLKEKIG